MADSLPPLLFGERMKSWPLPKALTIFEAYGLWNCLLAYHADGQLIEIIPCHDGDFFPETPFAHIDALRPAARNGLDWPGRVWPVRVDIDVTQKCTDQCYFCYSRIYTGNPLYQGAYMPKDVFDSVAGELASNGTITIRFTGGGEPLLHPQIQELLPIPAKYGLKSCIITNGDLLNDEIIQLLIDHVEHVRVSINAGSNETRNTLHRSKIPHASLSYIQEQIHKISQLREAVWKRQKRPAIWTTFLILPQNLNEIHAAARAMKACGADSISFRPVYHDLYRQLSQEKQQRLSDEIEHAREFHDPPNFHVFAPKRDLQEASHLDPRDHFSACISCGTRTVIETTNQGQQVKVCGLHRGVDGQVIGVVSGQNSFGRVWKSDLAKQVLADRPQQCSMCIDISMNITLNRIWTVLKSDPEAVFQRGWQRN